MGDLASLQHLEWLNLSGTGVVATDFWDEDHPINQVQLHSAPELKSLGSAVSAIFLELGYTPALDDVRAIANSTVLNDLTLGPLPNVDRIDFPDSLERLNLRAHGHPEIGGGARLKEINYSSHISRQTLEWMHSLTELEELRLTFFNDAPDSLARPHLLELLTEFACVNADRK